jgi:hypothetical protein
MDNIQPENEITAEIINKRKNQLIAELLVENFQLKNKLKEKEEIILRFLMNSITES